MLTGLYPPTHGTALVAGHDITTQIDQVHKYLGVCPQFDVLWDTLTPREHVLFYARLKGVKSSEENAHVMDLLKHVGLDAHADRKLAKELSGGMKRRLSVAIALAGNPLIVFLDEPSTGLDPLSRKQLWDVLAKANKEGDKCLILTTHSLEEADVLCTRIGIIAEGRYVLYLQTRRR
jgi:ABC-type multidrug transport system ATPase subunit